MYVYLGPWILRLLAGERALPRWLPSLTWGHSAVPRSHHRRRILRLPPPMQLGGLVQPGIVACAGEHRCDRRRHSGQALDWGEAEWESRHADPSPGREMVRLRRRLHRRGYLSVGCRGRWTVS